MWNKINFVLITFAINEKTLPKFCGKPNVKNGQIGEKDSGKSLGDLQEQYLYFI